MSRHCGVAGVAPRIGATTMWRGFLWLGSKYALRVCLELLRSKFCSSASNSYYQAPPALTIQTPEKKKVDLRGNSKVFLELLRRCSENTRFIPPLGVG